MSNTNKEIEYNLVQSLSTNNIDKVTTITFDRKFKFLSSNDDWEDSNIKFISEDGRYRIDITSDHRVDCCETNYISTKDISDTLLTEFNSNEFIIEFIDEYGIRINDNGIPCYSSQNGYYSADVDINIELHDLQDFKNTKIIECISIECEMD